MRRCRALPCPLGLARLLSCRRSYGGRDGEETRELLHFGSVVRVFGAGFRGHEPAGELRARADAGLAVDVREVRLDGPYADIQLGRDLTVRASLGRERGDALLGFAQLVGGRTAAADAAQLGARLLRPQRGAELLEERERAVEGLARQALVLCLPVGRAEREQGAGALERILHAPEFGEGAVERGERG